MWICFLIVCMYEDSRVYTDCWHRRFAHILLPSCVCVQHEKYTSQLQLSIKALEAKVKEKQQIQSSEKNKDSLSNVKLQDKAERKAHSLTGKQLWLCTRSKFTHQQKSSKFHDKISRLIVSVT